LTGADILSADPGGVALPVRHARAGSTTVLPLNGLARGSRLGDRDVAVAEGRWRMVMPDMRARGPSGCPAADRERSAAIHAVSGRTERAIGVGRASFVAVGDRRREAA
jgi:pimeloyl-ACP methyl ester carboxylesterase